MASAALHWISGGKVGRRRILDEKLMQKVASKLGTSNLKSVNIIVSKRASRLGVSAEAALVILAKEHGIGTSTFQRRLDPTKQAEIRDALPAIFTPSAGTSTKAKKTAPAPAHITSKRASLKSAIEYLIQNEELRDRCQDNLLAAANFDRAVNQATLVLEDRIRKKVQPTSRLVGESLVNFAFKEDLATTVLRVESNDPDEQRGFTQILRGIVPAFRNITHHHVTDTFSRQQAMQVCGFIDILLRVVDSSEKIR